MAISTVSSRQFNHNSSSAKKAALLGPVFITDRGKPTYVLLSIQNYKKISAKRTNLLDLLGMPGNTDIEFHPPKSPELARAADFS